MTSKANHGINSKQKLLDMAFPDAVAGDGKDDWDVMVENTLKGCKFQREVRMTRVMMVLSKINQDLQEYGEDIVAAAWNIKVGVRGGYCGGLCVEQ